MLNILLFRPILFDQCKDGPDEVNRTMIAIRTITGNRIDPSAKVTKKSNTLLLTTYSK